MRITAPRFRYVGRDERNHIAVSLGRQAPRSERTSLSLFLAAIGLLMLVLSIGSLEIGLRPELVTSLAIVVLAVGLRVLGSSPATASSHPG